jgi:hypothetical protein
MKKVVPYQAEDGGMEYHFVGPETYDDFTVLLRGLQDNGCQLTADVLEGIYSRTAPMRYQGVDLKLIFHEDVGNFLKTAPREQGAATEVQRLAERITLGLK